MSDDPNFSNPYAGDQSVSSDQMAAALENAASHSPADAKAAAAPKKPKEKRDLIPRPENGLCLCGCGAPKRTKEAAFLPGHDAKLKSKILQIENGKGSKSDVAPEGWAYAKAKWAHLFSGVLDDNWVYVAPPPKAEPKPAEAATA